MLHILVSIKRNKLLSLKLKFRNVSIIEDNKESDVVVARIEEKFNGLNKLFQGSTFRTLRNFSSSINSIKVSYPFDVDTSSYAKAFSMPVCAVRVQDEIDKLFKEVEEEYEYNIPWDDHTYDILNSVKRKYKNTIKPYCEKIKSKDNRWKSKCKNYIENCVVDEAKKKGYSV